ncbi:hypothetical protein TSUD_162710 [Trifolium subterraneum]|uniref:Leucine-rich repeat-containing N-terminal plant-type domain-containing protein n=1 Tax=Trifolium subterraneum TaxID=3900 RepID=A0A2Z6MRV1_TRISU|nr:hypothetical protein TSUD_162710 [Trifolium subterraneum]
MRPWQLNYSDFIIFKDLKSLDLSYAQIANCTKNDQGLENLEVLDLFAGFSNADTNILSCLDGLSSLSFSDSIGDNFIKDAASGGP